MHLSEVVVCAAAVAHADGEHPRSAALSFDGAVAAGAQAPEGQAACCAHGAAWGTADS